MILYLLEEFPRKYVIEAIGRRLKGVNCASATKNTALKIVNGCHHETHTNTHQELSTSKNLLNLHHVLVSMRYENLPNECLEGKIENM